MDDSFDVDFNEREFHSAVREYVVCGLLFFIVYFMSFFMIQHVKKRSDTDDLFAGESEDILVYRISVWLCSLSLAVAIGAVLLLPFSIVGRQVLLLNPNSYYFQWLNSSLIHSMWRYVFFLSNLCLFILLPFSYFFIESQGFVGLRKGIWTRVYEAIVLCFLALILIICLAHLVGIFLDSSSRDRQRSWTNLVNYQLPFVYSCVSLIGVFVLLTCTPFGFARLFSFTSALIAKPRSRKDIVDEMAKKQCDINVCERRIKSLTNPDDSSYWNGNGRPHHINGHNGDIQSGNGHVSKPRSLPKGVSRSRSFNNLIDNLIVAVRNRKTTIMNRSFENGDACSGNGVVTRDGPDIKASEDAENEMKRLKLEMKQLERQRESWLWIHNLKYPIIMLVLLALTVVSLVMVILNTVNLVAGFRTLPSYKEYLDVNNSSKSFVGGVAAVLEVIVICYFAWASLVGLYSLPLLCKLKPRGKQQCSMTLVIGNCVILLVVSSALPVLTSTLGLTTFDLLGNFGKLEWLKNFHLVLSYNLLFAIATGICLATTFTSTVRRTLCQRLRGKHSSSE